MFSVFFSKICLFLSVFSMSFTMLNAEVTANHVLSFRNPELFWFRPLDVAVSETGLIYVTNPSSSQVEVYDQNGELQHQWGSAEEPGIGEYEESPYWFKKVAGLAIDEVNDTVYVSDGMAHIAFLMVRGFGPLGEFKIGGGSHADPSPVTFPLGIVVDVNSDRVYVTGAGKSHVKVFNLALENLEITIGEMGTEDGQFRFPMGITLDDAGMLYVVDSRNDRIQVFTPDGDFLRSFGELGSEDGQFRRPSYIAIDDAGRVYVTDSENHRVQVFTSDGGFLLSFGEHGSEDGQFDSPKGIDVDGNGRVYVADEENRRIQVFQIDWED